MARMAGFNSPFLLGFDELEQLLERTAASAGDNYPPYNIEHIDERIIRISLAVAGFSPEDLQVTQDNNQLIIRGKVQKDLSDKEYLHRGIAARQFMRKFVLADGMDVDDAFLEHGLLNIDLARPEPKQDVRDIPVRG